MQSRSFQKLTLALAAALCFATNSRADQTLTFDFGAPSAPAAGTNLGPTATFTNSSQTLTATAQTTLGDSPNLWLKNGGTNETGLGIKPDSGGDSEIDRFHSVLLNFSSLESNGFKSIAFSIGSSQASEGYKIYGSNDGTLGSLLKTDNNLGGTDPLSVTSAEVGLFKYYTITASTNDTVNHSAANIVLASVTVTAVATPEPSTAVMAIAGSLTALGYGCRRRKRSAA